MRYAIYACETNYYGLHGMSNSEVDEFNSFEDAENRARELAEEVVFSYAGLENSSREDALEEGYEEGTEEFEECFNSLIEENLYWEIYEIKEEVTEPIEILDKMFYNNKKAFIEKYTVKEFN